MNDIVKWVLITLVGSIAVVAGGEALGIQWILVQDSLFAFLRMIGMVLLLFSGSAAAIQVARYYGHKNRELEQERDTLDAPSVEVEERELRHMVMQAVRDAIAVSEDEEQRLRNQQHAPLLSVDFEEVADGADVNEAAGVRLGALSGRERRKV